MISANEDENFWNEFVSLTWERESQVVGAFSYAEIMTLDGTYQVLLKSIRTFFEKRGARSTVRLFVDGRGLSLKECFDMDLIPDARDGSFQSYFSRVESKVDDKDYCLILDRAELEPKARDWIYGILKNLYSRLGYIAPGTFAFFLLGKYQKTPFGIHSHNDIEECDNTLIFTMLGEKRFWIWPKGYEERNPGIIHSKEPEKYISDSTLLVSAAGCLIYCPSDIYHLGELSNGDCFSLHLAVKDAADVAQGFYGFVDLHFAEYVKPEMIKKTRDALYACAAQYEQTVKDINQTDRWNSRLSLDFGSMQEGALRLPKEVVDAAGRLHEIFDEPTRELLSCKYWLGVLTSYGLIAKANPDSDKKLSPEDKIVLMPNHSVLWCQRGSLLLVGTAGETIEFRIAEVEPYRVLIEELNYKKAAKVGELVKRASAFCPSSKCSQFTAEAARLLGTLNSYGIFSIIS